MLPRPITAARQPCTSPTTTLPCSAAAFAPTLSLVVNYFNPKALSRVEAITSLCLEALKDYTHHSLEVILSDGSGSVSSVMRAQCERLGFVYTLSPTPKNFAAIYNHGLAMA